MKGKHGEAPLTAALRLALEKHGYTLVSAFTRSDGSPVLHIVLGVMEGEGALDYKAVERLIEETRLGWSEPKS